MGGAQHTDQHRLPHGGPDPARDEGMGRSREGRSDEGEDTRGEVLRTDRGGRRDTVPVVVCVRHDLRPRPDGGRGVYCAVTTRTSSLYCFVCYESGRVGSLLGHDFQELQSLEMGTIRGTRNMLTAILYVNTSLIC